MNKKAMATIALASIIATNANAFAYSTYGETNDMESRVSYHINEKNIVETKVDLENGGSVLLTEKDGVRTVHGYIPETGEEYTLIADYHQRTVYSSLTGRTISMDEFEAFHAPLYSTRSDVSYSTVRVSYADIKKATGGPAYASTVVGFALLLVPGATVAGVVNTVVGGILSTVNYFVPEDSTRGIEFTVKKTKYYRNHLGKRYVYRTDNEIIDARAF